MKRTRQVLMIALVATVLCADRAVASAASGREGSSTAASRIGADRPAGGFVKRLSASFRRSVQALRLDQPESQSIFDSVEAAPAAVESATVPHTLSPLQLRLPPPLV